MHSRWPQQVILDSLAGTRACQHWQPKTRCRSLMCLQHQPGAWVRLGGWPVETWWLPVALKQKEGSPVSASLAKCVCIPWAACRASPLQNVKLPLPCCQAACLGRPSSCELTWLSTPNWQQSMPACSAWQSKVQIPFNPDKMLEIAGVILCAMATRTLVETSSIDRHLHMSKDMSARISLQNLPYA